MLIQLHLLQNYAPSNLNRDDTGAPKDAVFGGYRRGRISSQCLKRSIRRSAVFAEAFSGDGLLGKRTRLLPGLVKGELEVMGVDQETLQAIVARVPEIGRESGREEKDDAEKQNNERGKRRARRGAATETQAEEDKEEPATRQLIFLDQREVRPLAEGLLGLYRQHGAEEWSKTNIKDITKALQGSLPRSVDIALFGRMTTSYAFHDVQAAAQVAHAFSTNALAQEFDYYTAVDDISGESGAGMIGDVEFNSCTYYKYLNLHWEQLLKNLGGDGEVARRVVLAFLGAAATAQPSGKQNSFAAHSLPDLVLVEVSQRNLPVSYANAFLKPARPAGDRSLVEASIDSLVDYVTRVTGTFGLTNERAFASTLEFAWPSCTALPSLDELSGWLADRLPGA